MQLHIVFVSHTCTKGAFLIRGPLRGGRPAHKPPRQVGGASPPPSDPPMAALNLGPKLGPRLSQRKLRLRPQLPTPFSSPPDTLQWGSFFQLGSTE